MLDRNDKTKKLEIKLKNKICVKIKRKLSVLFFILIEGVSDTFCFDTRDYFVE